jgi:hypothetical protein
MTKRRWEIILSLAALMALVVAGVLGFIRKTGEVENEIAPLIRDGQLAEPIEEGRYMVMSEGSLLPAGYIAIETAEGFGGDLIMAILVDTLGTMVDLEIISHNETPSFMKKVIRKGLIKSLEGRHFHSSFTSAEGVDVVTGASYTSEAIIECARVGSRQIARYELGLEVPEETASTFRVGIPEIALIILYAVALLGIYSRFKYRKMLRWMTLIAGLVILGFWFSVPLTLSRINLFLLGYWPDWHDNLYWYILVFGFFLILLVTRKNIYCTWICPLGCIQDGLGLVGNARTRFPAGVNYVAKWIQRGLAWVAILLALYYRTPVKVNYEIFGVSLSLTGALYLFIMTGIFFIASLFIKRPWCNYVCPITPVSDLIRTFTRHQNA